MRKIFLEWVSKIDPKQLKYIRDAFPVELYERFKAWIILLHIAYMREGEQYEPQVRSLCPPLWDDVSEYYTDEELRESIEELETEMGEILK